MSITLNDLDPTHNTLAYVHGDKDRVVPSLVGIEDGAGTYNLAASAAEFKGRGNYTWTLPSKKKPYQLKFADGNSQNLLGMGAARAWVLLANTADPSLMRNKVAEKEVKAIEVSRRWYEPGLRYSIRKPLPVIGGGVAVFLLAGALFIAAGLVQKLLVGARAPMITSVRKPIRCSVASSTSDASSTSPTSWSDATVTASRRSSDGWARPSARSAMTRSTKTSLVPDPSGGATSSNLPFGTWSSAATPSQVSDPDEVGPVSSNSCARLRHSGSCSLSDMATTAASRAISSST